MLEKFQLGVAGPQTLVLVPTRKIAVQIEESIQNISAHVKGNNSYILSATELNKKH